MREKPSPLVRNLSVYPKYRGILVFAGETRKLSRCQCPGAVGLPNLRWAALCLCCGKRRYLQSAWDESATSDRCQAVWIFHIPLGSCEITHFPGYLGDQTHPPNWLSLTLCCLKLVKHLYDSTYTSIFYFYKTARPFVRRLWDVGKR